MNVLDLLIKHNLQYRESGKDYLIKCLNPDHEDNNPSMSIDKITGIFHCFSCGFKGDLFKYYGQEPNLIDIRVAKLQDKIQTLLSNRKLEIPLDALPFTKKYRNISPNTYERFSAFTTSEIQDMEGRIVFPIKNGAGDIIVFLGRELHSETKKKYLVYPPHSKLPIFPAYPPINEGTLIIVEGIFDLLNLYDKGLTNVVCAFGTSTLQNSFKDKLAHFKILGVNKFYLLFDGDDAGIEAAKKLEAKMLASGMNAERIELPQGLDPGSMTTEQVMSIYTGLYGNENSDS